MTSVLGISAFYHDSAACILIDGKIVAAAQEERFTRIKHDSNYPKQAVEFVLNYVKLDLLQVDYIVFFEKPFLKFERILETYVAVAPKGFTQFAKAMPVWLKDKLFQKKQLIEYLKQHNDKFNDQQKVFFSEHHLSHAASAFYPSPFEEAIILTADGVGEWATTTVAIDKGKKLEIKKEIHFPHSLGLLYSAFTYYLGFKVNSGEYKLMGLAPYGEPKYTEIIKDKLIDIKEDGSFRLNQIYFDYTTGLKMTNSKFDNLFGQNVRDSKSEDIKQFHMDIAASIQNVTEEVIIKLVKSLKDEFKLNNLCLAGGVALNCVLNGKIYKENIFDNIWVQPASGDAGGSLGAALAIWHLHLNKDRKINKFDDMQGSYLGPQYDKAEIEKELISVGANYEILNEDQILKKTVESIINGDAIGWFQGRMEFGPRALGARSILADPRSPTMQKNLNLKVKFRESFRPFAPSILNEELNDWFDIKSSSPYMLMVAKIKKEKRVEIKNYEKKLLGIDKLNIKRSEIPAVTHVDYTSRIQTVHNDTNSIYYKLLSKFKEVTGCPLLINTSFNVRGEPIVNSPTDAFNCSMGTDLETLVIGNFFLKKNNQNSKLKKNYQYKFQLD